MKNNRIITLNVPSDLFSSGADGDLMSAPMQVSLAPDAVMSVASIGRPNRSFMLQQADTVQLAPTALQQAITSTKAVIPPPSKKAPIEKTNESEDAGDDEAFRAGDSDEEEYESESDDDGKILGMPKAIAIGVGVAVVAIGGFLIYKKVKGK
jgi:hypothetical protein